MSRKAIIDVLFLSHLPSSSSVRFKSPRLCQVASLSVYGQHPLCCLYVHVVAPSVPLSLPDPHSLAHTPSPAAHLSSSPPTSCRLASARVVSLHLCRPASALWALTQAAASGSLQAQVWGRVAVDTGGRGGTGCWVVLLVVQPGCEAQGWGLLWRCCVCVGGGHM